MTLLCKMLAKTFTTGVLETNIIEPADDKQDFERTTVLSRLQA